MPDPTWDDSTPVEEEPPPTWDESEEITAAGPQAGAGPAPVDKYGMPSMQAVVGTVPQGGEAEASFASKIRAARGLPPAYAPGTPEAAQATREVGRHGVGMLATGLTGSASAGLLPATRMVLAYLAGGGGSLASELFDPTANGGALSRANLSGLLNSGAEGLGLALQGAAGGASDAANWLRDQTGGQWFKLAGGNAADVTKAGGNAAANALGLEMRNQGLVQPWDFLPFSSSRMAQRVKDTLKSSGEEIGGTLRRASDGGVGPTAQSMKDAMDESVLEFRKMAHSNRPQLGQAKRIQKDMDALARPVDGAGAEPRLTADDLQTVKGQVKRLVKNWDATNTDDAVQAVRREMHGKVSKAQEEAVASLGPEELAAYKDSKLTYGTAKGAKRLQDSAAKRSKNQLAPLGGLHGTLAAITGALTAANATHDPLATIASLLAANAGVRAATSPRLWGLGLSGASQAMNTLGQATGPEVPLMLRLAAQSGLGLARPENR